MRQRQLLELSNKRRTGMNGTKVDTLKVPGASLYYTVRGAGPILLMLQGGAGDAEASNGIAGYLAGSYTLIMYDRRGMSRSKLDEIPEALWLETHSDDAHRLLAALTTEPAFVFGSSIGALIGLDLAARHPEQVRVLVAHEPPAYELLPGAERAQAEKTHDEIQEAYRREGMPGAMKKLGAASGVDFNDREPDIQLPAITPDAAPQAIARRAAHMTIFLPHRAPPVRRSPLATPSLTPPP